MSSPKNKVSDAPPVPLSNETLRERILTGSGTGNARGSLTRVASRFAQFACALSSGRHGAQDSPAAVAAAALRTELLLHDLEVRKLVLSARASDVDARRGAAALAALRDALAATKCDIEALTATRMRERETKRRREEYDALARTANERHPPMRATQRELERVRRETAGVREEVEEAQRELAVRERQMRVVMAALGDLTATLDEDELREKMTAEAEEAATAAAAAKSGSKRKQPSEPGAGDTPNISIDRNVAL